MGSRYEYAHADGSVITFEYRPGGTVDVIIHVKRGILRRGWSDTEGADDVEGEVIAELVGLPIAELAAAQRSMDYFREIDPD